MALYSVKTKLSTEDVMAKANAFFSGQWGLEVREPEPCCVSFFGGGGHVAVRVSNEGKQTEVELETREWDRQVQQFMHEIA